eukprot:6255904-Amphidinium_carterae.1
MNATSWDGASTIPHSKCHDGEKVALCSNSNVQRYANCSRKLWHNNLGPILGLVSSLVQDNAAKSTLFLVGYQ